MRALSSLKLSTMSTVAHLRDIVSIISFRYIVAAFEPSLLPHSGAYIADSDVDEAARAEHARGQVRPLFSRC